MAKNEQACAQEEVEITHKDLPLSCPERSKRIWDAHPRIYMPIEETGKSKCPYCGTVFVLKDFNPHEPHDVKISEKNILPHE